jgi:hypothetical protein
LTVNEQIMRDLLDDLARTPQAPSRVDVHQAVSAGRRRLLRRRMISAAAVVAVVCALAGGAVVVTSTLTRTPRPDTAAAPPTAASGSTSKAAAVSGPSGFEPTVRFASFGWLPDGFTQRMLATARWGVGEVAYAPGVGPKEKPTNIALSVQRAGEPPRDEWLRGRSPASGSSQLPPATDAPDVNGARARWFGDTLSWEYAPSTWASVTYNSVDPPVDLQTVLLRVAASVRLWGTEALRFPVHVTGIPAGLHLVLTNVERGAPSEPWWGRLMFSDGPDMSNDDGTPRFLSVEVGPDPARERSRQRGITGPNTQVDGHQAYLGPAKDGSQTDLLHVYDVDGIAITVEAGDPAIKAMLGPDGLIGVFRHTTVLPDDTAWTDQPVR